MTLFENNKQQMEGPVVNLVPANLLKRFTNYLIDLLLFSVLLSILLAVVAPVYPLMYTIMAKQPIGFADRCTIWFLYGLYMAVMEAVLKGKTIGKFITGTRAVNENGLPVNTQTAFMRGLIRIIPFEQLSGLLFPPLMWHDRWSRSVVVDESKSALPNN